MTYQTNRNAATIRPTSAVIRAALQPSVGEAMTATSEFEEVAA
jgi:hypothetical protein